MAAGWRLRWAVAAMLVLLGAVAGLQAARDRVAPEPVEVRLLYFRSPELIKRAVLSYDALAADVYWIRALQHYGRTRLAPGGNKEYELLYPLLDLTTSLDPTFNLAYRFGAIFLAEPSPGGAGRPDLAIALLEKGLTAQPTRWEFAQDIGFVHYWSHRDYTRAAEAFKRAAAIPGAPDWMARLAAVTLAEGGSRETSRQLWLQILNNAEDEWVKREGQFRLGQLDAMDQIEELERRVQAYAGRAGRLPGSWSDLGRAGLLNARPLDPAGFEYGLDPATGAVTLGAASTLNPLPDPDRHPR